MSEPNRVDGLLQVPPSDAPPIVEIAAHGDIVLYIKHPGPTSSAVSHAFRVSTAALRSKSKYFDRLLEIGRFGEGEQIATKHKDLRSNCEDLASVPSLELPRISIEDVGRISAVKSLELLLADFLHILHDKDTQTSPPVANLANLAVVADRFDALQPVRDYVRRKKILKILDGKTLPKADLAMTEERCRQRLLVALMLDYPPWTDKYSLRLLSKGWVGHEVDISKALWWDLPGRLEEELLFRRESILSTVQSLQTYFLALYASRKRQCRLGYDSSPECDSFQFGEMVRFFIRCGTLNLQSSIQPMEEVPLPYEGDISALLENLKQVPEYQVDRNHSHCGIRTRLVPLLDLVGVAIQCAGICGECWADDRRSHAWIEAKRPLLWKKSALVLRTEDHARRHGAVRDLFLASQRDWS